MITPQEYQQSPALSNSDIKLFEENIREFHRKKILNIKSYDEKSKHFEIGDLTDIFLLQKEKKDLYYTITDTKATEGYINVCTALIDMLIQKQKDKEIDIISDDINDHKELFIPAVKVARFQYNPEKDKLNWNPDTYTKNIIDNASTYFKEAVRGIGRMLVSTESYIKAESLVAQLKADPKTGPICKLIDGDHDDDIEVIKAFDMYGSWGGHDLKILGDFMIVNKRTKRIRPYDLKTSDNPALFRKFYLNSRYIRQGSQYSYVIKQNFPEYTIEPFTFMVVYKSSDYDFDPELFEMSQSDLDAGMNGARFKSGAYFKGWTNLLEEIAWHKKNDLWKHNKDYYEKDKYILDTFGNAEISTPFLDLE